jgi:hypothetical protein
MTEATGIHWKRIVVGGIAPHVISIALLIVAIIAYTILAAFGTGGEPGQGTIHQLNTLLFPLSTILITLVAAAWVVRRVDQRMALAHGFAVGLLVAVIGLAFGALDLMMAIRFVITVAAGIIGAKLEPVIFGR